MRLMSWLLGIALGLVAGVAVLVAGILALVLLAASVVWAVREQARPLGMGGLAVGFGVGIAGILALANARCAASNVSEPNYVSVCVAPDISPYLVAGAVVAAIGIGVTIVGVARGRRATP